MPFFAPDTGNANQLKYEDLEIISKDSVGELTDGYVIYYGPVTAKMGKTTLKTNTLIVRESFEGMEPVPLEIEGKQIFLKPKEAYALGDVELVDPLGTVHASNLWFTWNTELRKSKTGVVARADSVQIMIGRLSISAKTLAQSLEEWSFTEAKVSTTHWRTPLYAFNAKKVTIYPGKRGVADGVELSLLGAKLPPIPRFSFMLDPRVQGVQIPRLGLRQGSGIGVSWAGNMLINDSTQFSAVVNAFPKILPTSSFSYTHSSVPVERSARHQFTQTDEFGERYDHSFVENIYTRTLKESFEYNATEKNMWSVSSSFNFDTLGRKSDRLKKYSQPLEFSYEMGGVQNGWGKAFQAKVENIREQGGASTNRASLHTSLFAPLQNWGKLQLGLRFDGLAQYDRRASGYFGGEAAASYFLSDQIAVSVGHYNYKPFGTTFFDGDQFITNKGHVARADILGDSTNISAMWRYEPGRGWFDKQYRISQVMGPLEPVIVFRENPRQYQLGLKFRIGNLAKILQQRNLTRDKL